MTFHNNYNAQEWDLLNKVIVQLAHENADLVCQKIFKYNLFNVINKNDYCRLPSLGEMEMGGLFSQISKKIENEGQS